MEAFSQTILNVRPEPNPNATLPDGLEHYLEKMDGSVHGRLLNIENPTVRQLEDLFKAFENEHFESLPPMMRFVADRIAPPDQRLRVAARRYTM